MKLSMAAGENLISVIDDQGAKADKPEELIKTINAEIDTYEGERCQEPPAREEDGAPES